MVAALCTWHEHHSRANAELERRLNAEDYCRLTDAAPEGGIRGGRIYDAVIAACAASSSVDALLTFNARDFLSLGLKAIEIVVPA